MHVLTPYDSADLGDVPESLELRVWDGTGPEPDDLADVEMYVPPYLSGRRGLDIIASMPALRAIQTQTAGVEDVVSLVPSNVQLCNARGVHDASTAELAVALMLAAQRDLAGCVRDQDSRVWRQRFRPALADSTVLIIGYGAIGAAVERRLAGFEVEIIRVAAHKRDDVHSIDQLHDLLPRADVVVLTVPLTPQTQNLVDVDFLAAMKDDALLINVARGQVVDTDALITELTAGRLRAAIDVVEPEPLPADHALWAAPNILITPHVGGATTAMRPRMLRLLREQLTRLAAGTELLNVVHIGS